MVHFLPFLTVSQSETLVVGCTSEFFYPRPITLAAISPFHHHPFPSAQQEWSLLLTGTTPRTAVGLPPSSNLDSSIPNKELENWFL
ncbi:hypothetical protein RP20_CCG018770 [Aedes albopictus]|nr:hypothetical protein RP20_CCG018770 [Aedes albopictus]